MTDRYKDVIDKNVEYFTRTLGEFKDEHQAVAQSKFSHLRRFDRILELGDFKGRSLLDVGCGIGGFYEFLKERGINCDYTGTEINQKMLDRAKKRNPEISDRFFLFDIIKEKMGRTFDYVISVGPLNLKFTDNLNMDITMRLIKEMHALAHIGSAISMTSALTKRPSQETFYYDPLPLLCEIFKFCTNVRFDHTYLPHDFTLFLYKKDLYSYVL